MKRQGDFAADSPKSFDARHSCASAERKWLAGFGAGGAGLLRCLDSALQLQMTGMFHVMKLIASVAFNSALDAPKYLDVDRTRRIEFARSGQPVRRWCDSGP
jgi:hypothetical protein